MVMYIETENKVNHKVILFKSQEYFTNFSYKKIIIFGLVGPWPPMLARHFNRRTGKKT